CIGFGGASVDRRMSQELLKVITPFGLEASLKAIEELTAQDTAQRAALYSKLEQLDAAVISAFLEHLEAARQNSAETRNIRLAAIRSFFRFLEHRQPAALEQIRRILAIPFKRTNSRLVPYLVKNEVQALLDAPNPTTRDGI